MNRYTRKGRAANAVAAGSDRFRVIVCRVGSAAVIEEIDHKIGALQAIVGGYVEAVSVAKGMVLYLNENGKLDGYAQPANRLWLAADAVGRAPAELGDDDVIDVLFGNVLFAGEAMTRAGLDWVSLDADVASRAVTKVDAIFPPVESHPRGAQLAKRFQRKGRIAFAEGPAKMLEALGAPVPAELKARAKWEGRE